MPLFLVQHDGDLQGLGTCFSLDPWGSFCTADHVISDYRKGVPDGGLLAALFSYGLVYGTVGFNMTETFGKIIAARSLVVPYDNPLSFLHGQTSVKQLDLAFLSVEHPPQRDLKTLPIKSRAPFPALGDTVVAIGFPEIETVEGQFENVRTRLSEGMFAAYGIVTAIHIEGRDSSTPTPVFEV
jgi:serine protease Do